MKGGSQDSHAGMVRRIMAALIGRFKLCTEYVVDVYRWHASDRHALPSKAERVTNDRGMWTEERPG